MKYLHPLGNFLKPCVADSMCWAGILTSGSLEPDSGCHEDMVNYDLVFHNMAVISLDLE